MSHYDAFAIAQAQAKRDYKMGLYNGDNDDHKKILIERQLELKKLRNLEMMESELDNEIKATSNKIDENKTKKSKKKKINMKNKN
jgi:uncharacterized protein YlxW (UPF0749 family)